MKESPILMTDDMVRAILDKRKRVTRRPIKFPKGFVPDDVTLPFELAGLWFFCGSGDVNAVLDMSHGFRCPFGVSGDRLWVREAWGHTGAWTIKDAAKAEDGQLVYRSTHDVDGQDFRWWSSMNMPRWACRLDLPICSTRPERLLDVTNEEALLEGARWMDFGGDNFGQQRPGWSMRDPFPTSWEDCLPSARAAFGNYVNECYAGPRWNLKPDGDLMAKNPWVWRIEFDPERMRRYER